MTLTLCRPYPTNEEHVCVLTADTYRTYTYICHSPSIYWGGIQHLDALLFIYNKYLYRGISYFKLKFFSTSCINTYFIVTKRVIEDFTVIETNFVS